jgi:outer membrane lipoprotein carrier protein
MNKKFYISVLALLFFVSAFAQNDENSLLKKVQDKYNSISSFSTDFTQSSGGNKKISGKFFFKKDNNIRLDTKAATIISNGSTNWNYNKKQNKVIISDYDESDASGFSFNKIIYDYPSKSNVEQTSENGDNVLIIIPKNGSGLNFSQAKLWINNFDLIKKIEIKENNNSLMTIELSNYKTNQDLADSRFSFIPPEGTKVIDLRQ